MITPELEKKLQKILEAQERQKESQEESGGFWSAFFRWLARKLEEILGTSEDYPGGKRLDAIVAGMQSGIFTRDESSELLEDFQIKNGEAIIKLGYDPDALLVQTKDGPNITVQQAVEKRDSAAQPDVKPVELEDIDVSELRDAPIELHPETPELFKPGNLNHTQTPNPKNPSSDLKR